MHIIKLIFVIFLLFGVGVDIGHSKASELASQLQSIQSKLETVSSGDET